MKIAHRLLAAPAWIAISLACIQIGRAGPQVLDLSPRTGTAGTVITVVGTGFGTYAAVVSARVGGVAAGVVSVADQQVQLHAPAASGTVEVTVDGVSSVSLLPFTATRTVTGTFVPPAGMNATGYFTGSLRPGAVAGLTFSAQVGQHSVDSVWAWRGAQEPMFAALVFPGAATVQIDAASTALVMLTLSPLAPKGDPATVNEMIARVTGTPELAAAVTLIHQAGAGNYNWAEDARMANALEDLLVKAVTPPPPPQGHGISPRNFVYPGTGLARALVPEHGIAPLRLKYDIANAADGHLELKVSPSTTNPTRLHQNVEVWRVNPSWFTDGFAHINRMGISDRPTLLDTKAYGTGYVSAKLAAADLDLGERLSKAISGFLFGDMLKVDGDAKFHLPRDRPGVYMVNSYSGNYWYGLPNIDPGASQSVLISQIDVNNAWLDAVVANIVVTGVDLTSALVPDFKALDSAEFGKIVKSVSTKTAKALTAYISANGSLDVWGLTQVARAAISGLIKALVSIRIGEAAGADWDGPVENFVGGMLTIVKVVLSATSKVSSGLQAVERGISLNTPTHFAVERAVVTVGDPFAPVITAFHPVSGRAGEYINLTGEFLPSSATGYEVNFITFAGTGAPPPINARLKANVLATELGSWTIIAPHSAQWEAAFGTGNRSVFLGIKNTVTGGEFVTSANPAPNYQWLYHAPPVLTGVSPNPARSSGIITIEGTGFDVVEDRDIYLEVDTQAWGSGLTVTAGRVQASVSGLTQGPHSLRLVYRNQSYQVVGASNAVNFTVNDPFPPLQADAPRRLMVTQRSMNNVADGEITLYEAMALARGTLGRTLTVRPQGQDENDYESDWVDFPPGVTGSYGSGAAIRDSISIASFATGPVLQSVTAMPLPGEGDSLNLFGIIFDGAGAPAGTIGWDLRGVDGNRLDGGVEFRNFSGGGIVLGNGSQWNTVWDSRVTDCGGDGLLLSGDATDNYFWALKVSGSPGVGVRLSGAGVLRNELASTQAVPLFGLPNVMRVINSGSHGLLIEAGAASNIVDIWESRGGGGDGIRITGAGTSGNFIGGAYIPGYRDAAANTGHGMSILAGASANVVQNVAAGANGGDGFHIEGPVTAANQMRSIAPGFDYAAAQLPAFVSRNGGHSVRILNSAYNIIGTQLRGNFINSPPSALGGSNGGATVLITGAESHHNLMDTAGFGYMEPYAAPNGTTPNLLLAPSPTHGLHITGGAHDNVIGHSYQDGAVRFLATPNGAALRIEGAGTDNNRVLGCVFGLNRTDVEMSGQQLVRIGVHILNGPRGNRIGEAGNLRFSSDGGGPVEPYNSFGAIMEAAIRLENVQAGTDALGSAVGSNVVINSRMGFNVLVGGTGVPQHPEVGIHLKNSVTGQWIGSLNRGDGNQIFRYGLAGIWIENGNIPRYEERNRIAGNYTNAGIGTSGSSNTDPFAGPVTAQTVLVTGGSGQVIGEEFASYNQFNGSRLCVYIEGGSNHWLRGSWMDRGVVGSVFVHNGTGHRIGAPDPYQNHITRAGNSADDNIACVVLAGGSGHRLENNLIGDRGTADTIWGSRAQGVLIHESSGNYIGGTAKGQGNVIVRCALDGIVVRGAASTGNQIGYNRIGPGPLPGPNPGNAGSGIRFTAGAHDNLVGGHQIPAGLPPNTPELWAGNDIFGNGGDGVQVFGAATTGNSILSNHISGNGGLGIRHVSNGNRLQPGPAEVYADHGQVTGHVASVAGTPAGSRIQAFLNNAGPNKEGRESCGGGVVRPDGTFSFHVIMFGGPATLTVTATNAVTGDTSEFKDVMSLPNEQFGLSLAVPPGESALTKPWSAGAPFSAVVLTATAENAIVEVRTLKVKASGTGGFAAALAGVSLFEDVDRNGIWSAPDRELAPLTAFTAGEAELDLDEAFVSDSEERRWVLRLHPAGPPAGTVRLEITDANAVDEFYWEPLGASGVTAVFPLQSALHQAGGGGDPRAAWRTSYGFPADGSGDGADNADPDRDGLVNLVEYALGSSPVDGKDAARPAAARAAAPDRITFTYQKLRADVIYTVESATSLNGPWTSAGVDQGGAGPTVTASVPVTGGRKFLHLRVQ